MEVAERILNRVANRVAIIFTIDHDKNIQERSGEFNFLDENLLEENIVESSEENTAQNSNIGQATCEAHLINFNGAINNEDAKKELDALGLRPGTAKELVEFAMHIKENETDENFVQINALGDTYKYIEDKKMFAQYNKNLIEDKKMFAQYNKNSDVIVLMDLCCWGKKYTYFMAFEK